MLTQSTLLRVTDLFRAVADSEGYAEMVRHVLCEIPQFEPYTAFKHLSKSSQSITQSTLSNFLKAGGLDLHEQEVSYLIERFDSNEDNKISYADFLTVVLPKDNQELRKETHSRKSSPLNNGQALDRKVEHSLVKLFTEELKNFKVCEEIRRDLRKANDFTVMETFNRIDADADGYLNLVKIFKFVEQFGKPMADAEGKAFMLRVDKKATGAIGYSEFLEIFYQRESTFVQQDKPTSPLSPQTLVQGGKYLEKLRDNYSSPRLKYHSPTKKIPQSGELLNSPHSTKASNYVDSAQRTPKKEVQSAKPTEEESGFLASPELQVTFAPESISFAVDTEGRSDSPVMPQQGAELAEALKEVVEHNKYMETLKNGLALLKDFNIFNAFAIFDGDRKGVLSQQKLEQGLKQLQVSATKTNLVLLTNRLAVGRDGTIKYDDFAKTIMPKSPEFSRLLTARDPYLVTDMEDVTEAFLEKTLTAFKQFLKALIEGEALFESVKQRLSGSKDFNLRDAFRALSQDCDGVVVDHFKRLLAENGHFASHKDVEILVDRFAKDSKEEISYYSFVREMTPRLTQKH